MVKKKVIGMLLFVVFCVICFSGHTQQVAPAKLDVTLVVDCKNFHTKAIIEKVVKRELGKLKDVNLQDGILGKFILNIVAVETGCNICGRISITSLFLTRQDPTPRYMIREEHLSAYEGWNNMFHSFDVPKIQAGYCSRDKLEEYFKGTVNDFDKQVLEIERFSKQVSSDLLDNLRRMDKALENNQ